MNTPKIWHGDQMLKASVPVAIVVSRFNELITKELLHGAQDSLIAAGIAPADIQILWVPGAMEIPVALKALTMQKKYKGIVALSCVIKGDTDHYDYVCSALERGVSHLSVESATPIAFGVLTTENLDQALQRIGGKSGHKGREAAQALVEMISLFAKIH